MNGRTHRHNIIIIIIILMLRTVNKESAVVMKLTRTVQAEGRQTELQAKRQTA
jgi:hypothetical protein